MLECIIDQPTSAGATLTDDWLEVSGWAAGTQAIRAINLRANGQAWTRARFGDSRRDVESARPGYVRARSAGFSCHLHLPGTDSRIHLETEVEGSEGGRIRGELIVPVRQRLSLPPSESRECPCCHAPATILLSRFQRGPYRLYGCGNCGFGVVHPIPSTEMLKQVYDERYWQAASQRPRSGTEHYDSECIAGWLRAHHPNPRRVLEIGCGPGTLLAGLKKRGFEVRGQDYSAEAAALAQEVFGISVRVAPLSDLPDWPCDAVILRHVIEHSPSAIADLAQLARKLQPGTLLIIITPNLHSLAGQILSGDWEWFIPPLHLAYFSPSSLTEFANRSGFRIAHLSTRSGDGLPCRIALEARTGYQWRNHSVWEEERLAAAISRLDPAGGSDALLGPLGLGNEVAVVLVRSSE